MGPLEGERFGGDPQPTKAGAGNERGEKWIGKSDDGGGVGGGYVCFPAELVALARVDGVEGVGVDDAFTDGGAEELAGVGYEFASVGVRESRPRPTGEAVGVGGGD